MDERPYYKLSQISITEGELIICSDAAIAEYVKKLAEDKNFTINQSFPSQNAFFIPKNTSTFIKKRINDLINKNTFGSESSK